MFPYVRTVAFGGLVVAYVSSLQRKFGNRPSGNVGIVLALYLVMLHSLPYLSI